MDTLSDTRNTGLAKINVSGWYSENDVIVYVTKLGQVGHWLAKAPFTPDLRRVA